MSPAPPGAPYETNPSMPSGSTGTVGTGSYEAYHPDRVSDLPRAESPPPLPVNILRQDKYGTRDLGGHLQVFHHLSTQQQGPKMCPTTSQQHPRSELPLTRAIITKTSTHALQSLLPQLYSQGI
ncbi:regulator of ime2 [Diatrype stigma]|uniref:Regulator of ime2 n=1 Tax=Diatrype stigma TaxID=117547 RepID=A0AAN9UHF5_9PEZI